MTHENPMVEMLRRIHDQIFARMYEGNIDLPRDIETLQRHADTALRIDESTVAARFLTTIGAIYSNVGLLDQSLAAYDEAFAHYEVAQSPNHMAGVLNNIALVHRCRADYEQALSYIHRAVSIMEDANITIPPFSMILATQGILLCLVDEYETAELVFMRSFDLYSEYDRANLTEKQKRAGIDAHLDTLHGLAKVHMHFDHFNEAWRFINLAEELAQSTRNNIELMAIYLTQANVAIQDPAHYQSYEYYIERCNAIIDGIKLPIIGARILLESARLQGKLGNIELARRYAIRLLFNKRANSRQLFDT